MDEEPNVTKVREPLEAFGRAEVDSAFADWATNAMWRVLDGPLAGDYSQHAHRRFITTTWVQHYGREPGFEVEAIRAVNNELVVLEGRNSRSAGREHTRCSGIDDLPVRGRSAPRRVGTPLRSRSRRGQLAALSAGAGRSVRGAATPIA